MGVKCLLAPPRCWFPLSCFLYKSRGLVPLGSNHTLHPPSLQPVTLARTLRTTHFSTSLEMMASCSSVFSHEANVAACELFLVPGDAEARVA